ncbi:PREDICTED: pre-mRNA-splicing factor CWC22 homolog isoform X2 [Wasmannia auropunctata]|nr:PREDICTED: pre-mRNA-splicing factor CWC22 homolog isoform X2 [Wasmannia auropunctata]XP_011696063.1 PREDICTED: pre-mRNA-splicing factor CWC22 homolog isoform X2 [Wasmannia auropunctata]
MFFDHEIDEDGEESSDESDAEQINQVILDDINVTLMGRTVEVTIGYSLVFEKYVYKLTNMQLKPGLEIELCHMVVACCAEMRTYEKFFGLLAHLLCAINKIYVTLFGQIFKNSYHTIHRLNINELWNMSKFFAYLLFTDSISWSVLSCIKLNEDITNSNRIFIKFLFRELSEHMGLAKLNERVKDVTLQEVFEGLFPRNDPKNTHFAINFFTSIGLGGLTDDLKEHLKSHPKPAPVPALIGIKEEEPSNSDESTSLSSSTTTDSSSSSSLEDEVPPKKKMKVQHK